MSKLLLIILFLTASCATKTASYNFTRKQIEHGDLNFAKSLRVDEYVNAFPQPELEKPKANDDLTVQINYFTDTLAKDQSLTLAQVAIRTRFSEPEGV